MEETLYWLIEYGKVILGYSFLMFIWPMIVFRKQLSQKSVLFRFSFCVTGQVVLINTVVLLLGLFHLLNDKTIRLLFYGTLVVSLREYYALTPERKRKLRYLVNGTFGWKNFLLLERRKAVRTIEKCAKRVWDFYRKDWLEYSLLILVLVYAAIYFSWGIFQDSSYGFRDLYVHHAWIYQLSEGTPFSAGIYPEGMHCVIYAINALFGMPIYSVILLLGPINTVVVLLSAYVLMKELFQWRYSAVFVLLFFLTFGEYGQFAALSRLQCALPQEFGFPAALLCCLHLIRYVRTKHELRTEEEKKMKRYWDGELLAFGSALTATIVIHFYATIMAFFLCLGVAFYFWKRIFFKERFVSLVTTAVLSVCIAVVPMVAGYLTGIPLQGSLYWGMNVIQESVESPDSGENIQNVIEKEQVQEEQAESFVGEKDGASGIQNETKEEYNDTGIIHWLSKIVVFGNNVLEQLKKMGQSIYTKGLMELLPKNLIVPLLVPGCGILVFGGLGTLIYRKREEKKGNLKGESTGKFCFSGYCIIVYMTLLYVLIYVSKEIGLPSLIASSRLGFLCSLLLTMTAAIPLDFLFVLLERKLPKTLLQFYSAEIAIMIPVLIYMTGQYHGYLYFELSRYDIAAEVTRQIIETLPEKTYTIVSPTEELYQVIETGYHEELLTFVQKVEGTQYSIPTEYVFLYIEKRPLKMEKVEGNEVQVHFFDGPAWLGVTGKGRDTFPYCSICPEHMATQISDEAATKELYLSAKLSDSYLDSEIRTIVQSKAYRWCEQFRKLYPNEVKLYYEDENFVCYYWKQNMKSLYNLVME